MSPESTPRLSLVVSTIGRPQQLRRLLESLDNSPYADAIEVIVVDQSPSGSCRDLVESRTWSFGTAIASSSRGLSRGRNVGLSMANGQVVGFPDDDCWYRDETVGHVLSIFDSDPSIAALSGRKLTGDGRPCMLRWAGTDRLVTKANAHRTTISSTIFLRADVATSVGRFNEQIGAGSEGWYGAGEDTDYVLRALELSPRFVYRRNVIVHHDEPRDRADDGFVTKMLAYGCGQGFIWRRHRYPPGVVAYLLARKCAAAAVHVIQGKRSLARADMAFVIGSIRGLVGRLPKGRPAHPVDVGRGSPAP